MLIIAQTAAKMLKKKKLSELKYQKSIELGMALVPLAAFLYQSFYIYLWCVSTKKNQHSLHSKYYIGENQKFIQY